MECQAEFPPLRKIYDEFKDIAILSINPIDMKGRVEADAKYFKLPYDVLIGRDSDVLKDCRIVKLPNIFIVGKDGKALLSEKYLPYDDLKEEVEKALRR
jgi:hypothetical protein